MKKLIPSVVLSAGALLAQPQQIIEDKQVHIIAAPAAGAMGFMNFEMGFEATLVKGAPFTGDFVTENTQTLADGNRIRNSNTTAFARDGEGRTRREVSMEGLPVLGGSAAAHKTIFIHDPVAKVDYILDPQAKTVRKINLGALPPKTVSATAAKGAEIETVTSDGNRTVMIRRSGPNVTQIDRAPLPPGMVMTGGGGAVIAQRIQIGDGPAAAAGNANYKNEPLGKRMIEGLEADGTRTTVTIPAGQIGNDRALETVSERWFSDELKTVVLTSRKDPRTGENTYRLTNLRRGEPARQLFEVPPDYKIITEDNVGPNVFRMRLDKKP